MLKYPHDNARYVWKYFDSKCCAKSPQTEAATAENKPLSEDYHIMCWCCIADKASKVEKIFPPWWITLGHDKSSKNFTI